MVIIPGMDIMNGMVTNAENIPWIENVIANHDPVEVANLWKSKGAKRLYIADLDGSRYGYPVSLDQVKDIVDKVGIKVFLGGGIRNSDNAKKVFDIGVDKIVIGTNLALEPDFAKEMFQNYRENVIVALGNMHGFVAIHDWTVRSDETIYDFAKRMEGMGAKYIVYNDIERKGAHGGPNLPVIEEMLRTIKDTTLIVGCGVSSLGDIERLRELNINACVMVTALYNKMIDYNDAVLVGNGTKDKFLNDIKKAL